MSDGHTWHIPFISKYERHSPQDVLHVVCLQRLTKDEHDQILQNLNEKDEDWANSLDVPVPSPRRLILRKWIRDYWPSSDAILELAKQASKPERNENTVYRSYVFVDSGWEAGNVIAARWEGNEGEERLVAARVPMNIANFLLTVCEKHEGHTLSRALGDEVYEESKVDFYKDASSPPGKETQKATKAYEWPAFLPDSLALNKTQPVIVSLRTLEENDIETVLSGIINGDESEGPFSNIKIHNWQGPQPKRADILRMYHRMFENTPEEDRDMYAFFIDHVLREDDVKPQIIAAVKSRLGGEGAVDLVAVKAAKFMEFWKATAAGQGESKTNSCGDIWSTETIYDFEEGVVDFDRMSGAPVIFLKPFSEEEERKIRFNLAELSDIEEDEDWGADWIYVGYPWKDGGKKHTLEELRDLFESCDPMSPSFDSKSPGPYRFKDYPHHFIAVDERALEPEPKVVLCSSLDFSGEETLDQLGWYYGEMDAKEVHLAWVNLDIANMGPGDFFEPEKLWLSDLKEYAEHDWDEEQDDADEEQDD